MNNAPNQNVAWQINGIAGGNSAAGEICVTASNPCQQISASNGGSVVHLTLQVPSTAATGPRTLCVENPNKDKAAGTGAIEVR